MYQYFIFFLSAIFSLGVLIMVVSVGSVLLLVLLAAIGLFLLYLRIRFWLYKRKYSDGSMPPHNNQPAQDDGIIEGEYDVVDDDRPLD